MATKLDSNGKKAVKRKTTAAAPEITGAGIDQGVRRQLVAVEAYFLAEQRGFAAGRELDDWVAAEAVVDSRLRPYA
jgi:hypothetical protein